MRPGQQPVSQPESPRPVPRRYEITAALGSNKATDLFTAVGSPFPSRAHHIFPRPPDVLSGQAALSLKLGPQGHLRKVQPASHLPGASRLGTLGSAWADPNHSHSSYRPPPAARTCSRPLHSCVPNSFTHVCGHTHTDTDTLTHTHHVHR